MSLLEDENEKLREFGATPRLAVTDSDSAGPAVSSDPLQKGVSLIGLAQRVALRHKALTLLAVMMALTSWTGCPKTSISKMNRIVQTTTWSKTSLISSLQNSYRWPQIRLLLFLNHWSSLNNLTTGCPYYNVTTQLSRDECIWPKLLPREKCHNLEDRL